MRTAAGLLALGAKKAGDTLANMVLDQTREETRAVLARALQESSFSDDEKKNMTPAQLKDKLADLKIGGKTFAEVFKDDPKALAMLGANAVDISTDIGVYALSL